LANLIIGLLEYPITKVTKTIKHTATPPQQIHAAPVAESGRIISFPVFYVTERPAGQRAIGGDIAEPSSCASRCWLLF